MKNPEKLNLILELIENEYENERLDLESLKKIIEVCNQLGVKEEFKIKHHEEYLSFFNNDKNNRNVKFYNTSTFGISEPFPMGSKIPSDFITEFRKIFQDKFERSSHIYKAVADGLFQNENHKIIVILAQIKDEIILCVEKDNQFYQINNVDALLKIDPNYIENYNRNFGSLSDEYLKNNRPEKERNTRRFEITRNVYDYFEEKQRESIILFPAICMDESTNNPSGESYMYRVTYMMTFGNRDLDFQEFEDVLIYDRNGLCPPGTC